MRIYKFYIAFRQTDKQSAETAVVYLLGIDEDGQPYYPQDNDDVKEFDTYNDAVQWLNKHEKFAREHDYQNIDRTVGWLKYESEILYHSYKIVAL